MSNGPLSAILRDAYRILTYSPLRLHREHRSMRTALRAWDGENLLLFPYMGMGGAERVHAAIGAAIRDRSPLTVIFGRKRDHGFEGLFRANGAVLEIPCLLHHPLTRAAAHRRLAEALNKARRPVVLASLSAVFFDLMPLLKSDVRLLYLQHAFLHQPDGNLQWRSWLPHVARIDALLFVSRQAMAEFERFLIEGNVSAAHSRRLRFMPNAVSRFAEPGQHATVGLLFVGRDSPEKRLDLFLRVCAVLHAKRPGAFRFSVAGASPRPTTAPVEFLGSLHDDAELGRAYSGHDVLLLTSDREGFPLSLMEAMAHGLAILSTPVGDVPNRVDSSFAVVSASAEEEAVVETFVASSLALLDAPERLRAMREAAYHRARAEFSMSGFNERYRALFEEMKGEA